MIPYLEWVYSELHLFEPGDAYNNYMHCEERIAIITERNLNKLKELGNKTKDPLDIVDSSIKGRITIEKVIQTDFLTLI
jgi:hypothetical protein